MQSSKLSKEEKRALKAQARLEKEALQSEIVEENNNQPISILCVRFGDRYGRDYVEKLRNMVSRHCTIPYEFVCLTDDTKEIKGVRKIYQSNAGYARGWWHKVHMFDSNLPIKGRILYFDLDVVIHANIDKLVNVGPGEFYGIQDFNRKFHRAWKYLNSSVMSWEHGTQHHIWENFKVNPRDAQRMHGDQDWIWKLNQHKIKFWPEPWIQSYKWEIRSREELSYINGTRTFREEKHNIQIHKDCCVTVFHGDPKPQDIKDSFVVDNWQ